MLFSVVNRNSRNNNNINNANNNNNVMPIHFKLNDIPKPMRFKQNTQQIVSQTIQPTNPPNKKMKWGEPTWFLFHTLSHKLKPEYSHIVIKPLLQLIYTICINLPCPTCASHAKDYLNAINFNSIQTKNQLINLFFVFHNTINEKKSYPIFTKQQLDEKYENANTINIIRNFIYYFNDTHFNINMISSKLYRNNLIISLNKWFNENIHYFDL